MREDLYFLQVGGPTRPWRVWTPNELSDWLHAFTYERIDLADGVGDLDSDDDDVVGHADAPLQKKPAGAMSAQKKPEPCMELFPAPPKTMTIKVCPW